MTATWIDEMEPEPYGYQNDHYLAPDHGFSHRPLSTRRPQSRESRNPSTRRRPSLHRNYHSDNEAAEQEIIGYPEAPRPPVPEPPSIEPGYPLSKSSRGDLHQPMQLGPGTFVVQTQQLPHRTSHYTKSIRREISRDRDTSPESPPERRKRRPSPPRIRHLSTSPPNRHALQKVSAKRRQSPPRLKRRSPSPHDRHARRGRSPSPPVLVRRRSSTKTRPTRESAPNLVTRKDVEHRRAFSVASDTPPGMKMYRKDRTSTLEVISSIPGSFPSVHETVHREDSRSETSGHKPTGRPWFKKALSTTSVPFTSASGSSVGLGVKAYQYRALGDMEFRLIKILPARMSTIKCEIFHASLKSPPPFTAVSYAWGDVDDTRKILLEGASVEVAVSLHGALEALREKKDPVLVWVDFLSIDQQNKEERSHQVQLMTKIYTQAESVAIWLGPEADDSHLAMELLEKITAQSDHEDRTRRLISSYVGKPHFAALVSLFERDYWRRLWVVQEVFNAKDIMVYCGSLQLPWSIFKLASEVFWHHKADLNYYFPGNSEPANTYGSSNQDSYSQALVYHGPSSLPDVGSLIEYGDEALLELMRACRGKLTTDPRDKIFGILGVLPEDIRSEFAVDYSLSVKEVYINLVDYLLSTTERLDIIREAIHFPLHNSSTNLPSWVPDWSHTPETTSLRLDFTASQDTQVEYRLLDGRKKLEISAIYIDTISQHGMAVGTLCTVSDHLMAFLHWRALLLGSSASEEKEDYIRIQDAFCRTLSLDVVPAEYETKQRWLTACYHVFSSLLHDHLPQLPLDRELERYIDVKIGIKPEARGQFLKEHFGDKMMGRCLCITEEGYIGMGSGAMRVDDIVVVPLGCSTPVILRPEGERGEYRFVGDVYLHGFMDGKAVEEYMGGRRDLGKFVIH